MTFLPWKLNSTLSVWETACVLVKSRASVKNGNVAANATENLLACTEILLTLGVGNRYALLGPSFFRERKTREPRCLQISVAIVAGPLPGNQFTDRGTGAGNGLLVGFDFRARGFFADGPDAESYFLFFGTHLDNLELVLDARFKMQGLTVAVDGFGLVAQAFDTFRDFNERSECGHAQDFAVNDIADVMSLEERLPHIGLKLLHAEREPTLIRLDGENDRLHAVAFFQNFRRMLDPFGPA